MMATAGHAGAAEGCICSVRSMWAGSRRDWQRAGIAIETAKNAGFITVGIRDMSNGDDWQQDPGNGRLCVGRLV